MGRYWASVAACAAALVVAAPAWAVTDVISETPVEYVIDGDTFVIAGGERIRVRNFDTAELRHYECREELALARAARAAAQDILSDRSVTLYVTDLDRYDRLVADVVVHPRGGEAAADFVALMVASGHGARWDYGFEPQPDWCPRPSNAWADAWSAAAVRWAAAWITDALR